MAIIDYQAVFFFVLIILLHLSRMYIQDLLAFFHDTLHADLITLVKIIVMFTNMSFILNNKWFHMTTETFTEHVLTLVLHIGDEMDIFSFAKESLHLNQLIKGLKTSYHVQRKYVGDDLSNNILSDLYINKLVSKNCALEQQTEAFVKDFGDRSRTVFVVVESPDVEEGKSYDIFYELPLVPNYGPSLHQDESKKKTKEMKKKRREHLSLLSRRLETFKNTKLFTDAQRFAESGFFFCGMLDRVCCYECGIVISKWKKEDDPLLEHVRHSLDCPFLVSLLPEDLRHDIREQLQHARRNEPSNSKTGLRDQYSDKEKACTNILHTPAAQRVLDAGYTKELVLAAIRRLDIRDSTKLTGSQILLFILDAEDKGIDLTLNTQNNSGYESRSQNKNDEECQELLAENQRLKSLMLCKKCQVRERNILLLPCAHRSLCHECANEIKMCPECWKPVKDRVRSYMA